MLRGFCCHSDPAAAGETAAGRLSCDGKSLSFQTPYRKELKERLDVHEAASAQPPMRLMAALLTSA
jgi:hypothetical protein